MTTIYVQETNKRPVKVSSIRYQLKEDNIENKIIERDIESLSDKEAGLLLDNILENIQRLNQAVAESNSNYKISLIASEDEWRRRATVMSIAVEILEDKHPVIANSLREIVETIPERLR